MTRNFSLSLEAEATLWFAVAGAPRSGTTMFSRFLNTHPSVGCLHEVPLSDFINNLYPFFAHDAERVAREAEVATNFTALVAANPGNIPERQGLAWRYTSERDAKLGEYSYGMDAATQGNRAARALFEVALGKSGLTRLGTKIPNMDLVAVAAALAAELPNLRLLHIFRRPSDVINSSLARRNEARRKTDVWHINTVEDACKEWITDWNQGEAARAALGDRLLTVKYEDFLMDGRATSERIAQHLRVENAFDPSICQQLPDALRGYALIAAEAGVIEATLGDIEAAWNETLDVLFRRFPRLAFPLPDMEPI